MSNTPTTTNNKVMVRCKDCRRTGWVHYTTAQDRTGANLYYHPETHTYGTVATQRSLAQFALGVALKTTPQCANHFISATNITGTFNPERVCNARCMGAVSPACSCSCGGANHGGKFGPW